MNEIELYYDPEKKQRIEDQIEFTAIAGNKDIKKIYVVNTIKFDINLKITLSGDDSNLISKSEQIIPAESMKDVLFVFSPKLTAMQPIKADLKINIKYLVT